MEDRATENEYESAIITPMRKGEEDAVIILLQQLRFWGSQDVRMLGIECPTDRNRSKAKSPNATIILPYYSRRNTMYHESTQNPPPRSMGYTSEWRVTEDFFLESACLPDVVSLMRWHPNTCWQRSHLGLPPAIVLSWTSCFFPYVLLGHWLLNGLHL